MSDEVIMVHVSKAGRITIPAKHRKAIGLEEGGVAVVRLDDGEIRIRPMWAVLAELQAKVRKRSADSGESVDWLLADRREEAPREEY